jgi:3-dehydroquinate dehydratase type I
MKARIAVAIAARTADEATRMARKAYRLGGDLAEIRLDYLGRGESYEKIAKVDDIPLIATFRSKKRDSQQRKEKGFADNLIVAAEAGFNYVDIEIETRNLNSVVNKIHRLGARTIVSHHDFQTTPSTPELDNVLRVCRASDAWMPKIVTTVRRLEDNLRLLSFIQKASKDGGLVCFGMGKIGIQSRIFSPIYGASFTFASLDERPVAPGQISVMRMRRIYDEMGYS